jgi:hypothetical protein
MVLPYCSVQQMLSSTMAHKRKKSGLLSHDYSWWGVFFNNRTQRNTLRRVKAVLKRVHSSNTKDT